MKPLSRLAPLAALAAALLLAPASLAAQGEVLMPTPLAADAPTAQRARAVAELVLAGDRAKLEAYLAQHAAPSFTGGATYADDLARVLEQAKTGARTIVRFDGLGAAGVGVALASAAGAPPERAVLVAVEPAAPHRVTGLRMVRIQQGDGDA